MADGALELQIPQEFFDTLKEIKDNTLASKSEAEASIKNSARIENFKNPDKLETTKIAPVYPKSSQDALAWRLIGKQLFGGGIQEFERIIPKILPPPPPETNWVNVGRDIFSGGTSTLINGLKDYDKSKEYSKKATFDKVVKIPEVKQPDLTKQDLSPKTKSWIDKLFMGVAGAILAAGIAFGNHPFGQIVESVAYLPNFLKQTFFNSKWMRNVFARIIKITRMIATPFMSLAKTLDSLGKWAAPIANWVRGVGKSIGSLGKILNSIAVKVGGRFIAVFKRLPFIGALVGFWQSYLKFEKGDVAGGTLELVTALLGLVPFPGFTFIAVGLNLAQGLLDYAGVKNGSEMLLHALGGFAPKMVSMFSAAATKLFKPLGVVFKKLPLIGSLISLYEAYNDFSNGNYIKGTLHLGSAIATCFPGLGTAIAIGLDIVNGLMDKDDGGSSAGAFTTHGLGYLVNGKWGMAVKRFLLKFGTKAGRFLTFGLKKIPFVGALFSAYSAYQNFSKGNWFKGILDIGAGIAGCFPGIGTAIAVGLDIVNAFIGDGDDEEDDVESKSAELAEEGKGSGEKAKADMKDTGTSILGLAGKFLLNTVFFPLKVVWSAAEGIWDFFSGLFSSDEESKSEEIEQEASLAKQAGIKAKDIAGTLGDVCLGFIKTALWPVFGMYDLITGVIDWVSGGQESVAKKAVEMYDNATAIVGQKIDDTKEAVKETAIGVATDIVPAIIEKKVEFETAVTDTLNDIVTGVSSWFGFGEDENKAKVEKVTKPVKSNVAPVKKAEDAAKSVADSTDKIVETTADTLDMVKSNMGDISTVLGTIGAQQKPLVAAINEMANNQDALAVKKDIMTSVDSRVDAQHRAFVNNTNVNGGKLDQLIDRLDTLIYTVREKPVAFADMRTNVINNNGGTMARMTTGDVRANYKNLG